VGVGVSLGGLIEGNPYFRYVPSMKKIIEKLLNLIIFRLESKTQGGEKRWVIKELREYFNVKMNFLYG
jgi:hypothetical protein